MKANEVSFIDDTGSQQQVALDLSMYQAAAEDKISLSQYINRAYPTNSKVGATTFEQMAASSGMFVKGDKKLGINPPSMKDVMSGQVKILAGAINRSGGSEIATPASRILFPEIVMQAIESELNGSDDPFLAGVNKMIAITSNVNTPRVERPIINTSGPKATEAQPIAQLTAPPTMVSITVADQSYRIPTMSVGLEISEEAQQSSTLDLVSLALSANAREQAILRAEADLTSMFAGDADLGESAVSAVAATTFDAAINGTDKITQKGWVKFLRDNYRKMNKDWLIMNIDTALLIENRLNKPTTYTDDPTSPRIDSLFTIENLAIPTPNVLLVDSSVVAADTVYALDSRYAIRKVVNVSATYSAIEQYVLRKGSALRIDYGYVMKKLYNDAWTGVVLGT